jgi:PAS domain S-box-containing protein
MMHFQRLSIGAKENHSFETRVYRKGRTVIWLDWHVVVKERRWFINARDVTDIKQVELIRNYIAAVVKQSGEAVYIHNHEGKIISWNRGAERMYGYSEDEALKMKVWNIIPEFLLSVTEDAVDKIMAGEKIESQETKRISKHGKMIDVLFSASVLTDEEDQLKSIAITERDITEQKIADEKIKQLNTDLLSNVRQLETLNKELESFSYSVSHDLRAPLRSLIGYSKILEEDCMDKLDDDNKRTLNIIIRSAGRMNKLIDDLLEFSKFGKGEMRKSEIDTEKLVRTIIDEIDQSIRNRANITLNILLPSYADYNLLMQVWSNLISNALKYSAKNATPQVEIGCSKDGNEVTYYIKDNGAGFDMRYIDKLFGVFQRLHKAEEFEGTGVGLALVQRIISRHGGRVWAEGKVNKGATFFFSLPV